MVHYLQNHPKRWYGLDSEHRPLELELLKFQFLIQKTSYTPRKLLLARTVNCINLSAAEPHRILP